MSTPAVPLSAPLYGATLPQAISRLFRKYATFSGRASRAEYWWTALVHVMVTVVCLVVTFASGVATGTPSSTGGVYLGDGAIVGVVLLGLWILATLIPGIALTVRRLHDAGFSGWLVLLNLAASIGGLVVLILTLMPPNPAGARFDAPDA